MSRAAARSPGLLALDLALSSPESHYPRPRDRCPMSYWALAHGVVRSGLACIGKTVRQRRRVVGNEVEVLTTRGPGRGALGSKPAGLRLHKKLVTSPLRGSKSAGLRLHKKLVTSLLRRKKSADFRLQNLRLLYLRE